jgi:hypothetical protein
MFPLFGILFLIALSDIFRWSCVSLLQEDTRLRCVSASLSAFRDFSLVLAILGRRLFGRVRFWPYTLEHFGAFSATLVVSRLEHLLVFTSRGKSIDDYSPNKTPQPTGIN